MAQSIVRSPSYVARKRHSKQEYDSPSKQLMKDLERALGQIQLQEVEEHKVRAYERRSFYGYLDQLDQERATIDVAALNAATARHNAVRKEAENELNAYYKQLEEEERKRREEEERKERERVAREQAERERREREEAERREAERKAKEEAQRKAAEAKAKAEADERARKEREDTAAREQAEKEQKERQEKEAAEKQAAEERQKKEVEERAKLAAKQPAPVSAPPATGATALSPELEALHNRYLEIHRRLKDFRRTFWEECKKNKEIKTKVGELRRSIRASVGQLVEPTPENPKANSKPHATIRDALLEAVKLPVPPVNLGDFIALPDTNNNLPPAPSALIYCLNIFSKAIISQFSNESGVNTKAAEPAGILTASIFAHPGFQPAPNISLISILLAKFHAVCPVLFGIFPGGDGNNNAENTLAGKQRLGWRREDNTFVTANRHYERMAGLGAGFAAISLRNFSKSQNKSPCPPAVYWECLANILNVPTTEVVPTHLLVLKGMIENSADRFVMFYSTAAVAALRRATTDFPQSLPEQVRKSPACNSLVLLPETLKRDKNIDFF